MARMSESLELVLSSSFDVMLCSYLDDPPVIERETSVDTNPNIIDFRVFRPETQIRVRKRGRIDDASNA